MLILNTTKRDSLSVTRAFAVYEFNIYTDYKAASVRSNHVSRDNYIRIRLIDVLILNLHEAVACLMDSALGAFLGTLIWVYLCNISSNKTP